VIEILKEAFSGSFKSLVSIATIVIPLMVVMELAKDYNILDKIASYIKFLAKPFNMSKNSSFPLLVGLIFGLAYGAGVILQSAKDGQLTKRDMILIAVFLAACHAIIEDTLIFVAVGANGWILLITRSIMAFVVTYILSRTLKDSISNITPEESKVQ